MQGLSNDTMRRQAPSIFATKPWQEVSDRYRFFPTIEVIKALRKEGWYPTRVQESGTRIEGKQGFVKHLVRFRNQAFQLEGLKVGDSLPEIVLINSHDRGSSFILMAGIFRLVCSNGMIIQNADFGRERIRHTGDNIMSDILTAASTMARKTPRMAKAVADFQTITLGPVEQGVYAEAAAELRWGRDPKSDRVLAPFRPERLLVPRREEDRGSDLWSIYNRVQENLVRGGLPGISANGRRRVRTRAVNSVGEDVRLNSALWTLSEKMAAIKAA